MRLSRYECRKMCVCEVEADLGRDKEAGAHNLLKSDLNQGIDRPGSHTLAWNTMRAVEELSLCPGIVEGAQNAAITEELYRRSPRRQKKRKKKLQVQPCIGWSSNY